MYRADRNRIADRVMVRERAMGTGEGTRQTLADGITQDNSPLLVKTAL